jgi:tetratricopeptide (TPR) repeat protein
MGAIFPLLGERAQELADIHELDGFGGFISRFLFTGAVLLPLVLLLTLHATGGLEGLVRRLTPSGRALERNKAGLALFQRGGYVAALAEFTEAVRLNPRLATAYTNRAAVHYQLNKLEEALADLDAALRQAPNLAAALSWRGRIRARLGDHEHALVDLDRAIALGAREGAHFATRGGILLARGEYDRALSDCTEAILRGNNDAADFSNRGMAWLGKGEWERARMDFDEAIERDPGFGLAFNNRGMVHLKQGAYARASADFHEAMRLSPELPNSYKNLAWLMATCPHAEHRDGPRAADYAKKALQLALHKEAEWLGILAAAHAEAGDFEEAINWQSRCVEQAPPQQKGAQEERLNLYREGRPYREQPALTITATPLAQGDHHVRAVP